MRVKRSVDFRMAPKKSSKGKGVAAEPAHEKGWNRSKCSESDLETLVLASLLVPRSIVQWRPALGKDHPYENTGEIIAFAPYLEWILGFPCSFFFSRLLRYRIQLHYLTPNSFVHISIFVHFCEAFLKPQLDSYVLDVVGGAGLQLR
jgi:hypothetical protein